MIRPFTAICCVLAAVAVLYTYQSKHQVQLLDRLIEKTLIETAGLREQSRALQAEWTLRENPERLRTFADQYLSLRPMLPSQFTALVELNAHLPATGSFAPAADTTDTTEEPAEMPVALTQPPAETQDETVVASEELPIPPLPVPAPPIVIAASPAPPASKPAPPRASLAQAVAPVPASIPVQAPPIQAAPILTTRAPAAPIPVAQAQPVRTSPAQVPPLQARQQPAPVQQPPVQAGSLLSIGRGSAFAPLPRPIPVSTTNWTNGN